MRKRGDADEPPETTPVPEPVGLRHERWLLVGYSIVGLVALAFLVLGGSGGPSLGTRAVAFIAAVVGVTLGLSVRSGVRERWGAPRRHD